MTTSLDAIVVGYGPTGATVANLLGKRGWRVLVLEESTDIYDLPRAITADQEAMRTFQAVDLAHVIAPLTTPHPGTDFLGLDGSVIKRYYPAPPPRLLGWEPNFMFEQPKLESVLRQGLDRYPNVSTKLGHRVTSVEQSTSAVSIVAVDLQKRCTETLEARYVLACDGARSRVRKCLDLRLEDLGFDEWWVVVDCEAADDCALPDRCVQYCHPSRPGTFIVGPGRMRRWELKILPGEIPDDFDAVTVRRILQPFVDTAKISIRRIATYRFHAVVAESWRRGATFLLGDAAHQMPPFLGQGMCAGIRDAFNLAWKLDLAKTHCCPELLDTYEMERKSHVRAVVERAKEFGVIIGELDVDRAKVRDSSLRRQLAERGPVEDRQQSLPILENGFLYSGRHPAVNHGASGQIFPQPIVRTIADSTGLLDAHLGPDFAIVFDELALSWDIGVLGAALEVPIRFVGIAQNLGTRQYASRTVDLFREVDDVLRSWMSSHGIHAVVVRPDRQVYGAASAMSGLIDIYDDLVESLHI